MKTFDVWHQYLPVIVAERKVVDGQEVRLFEPALYPRGTVQATDEADAIAQAISLKLSPYPVVRQARH